MFCATRYASVSGFLISLTSRSLSCQSKLPDPAAGYDAFALLTDEHAGFGGVQRHLHLAGIAFNFRARYTRAFGAFQHQFADAQVLVRLFCVIAAAGIPASNQGLLIPRRKPIGCSATHNFSPKTLSPVYSISRRTTVTWELRRNYGLKRPRAPDLHLRVELHLKKSYEPTRSSS